MTTNANDFRFRLGDVGADSVRITVVTLSPAPVSCVVSPGGTVTLGAHNVRGGLDGGPDGYLATVLIEIDDLA